jgi:hypothetical protein
MKKAFIEKSAVVLLFVLVLVVFSFAERETKKVFSQYNKLNEPVLTQASTTGGPVSEAVTDAKLKTRN